MMMGRVNIIHVFVLLVVLATANSSKYSKENNKKNAEEHMRHKKKTNSNKEHNNIPPPPSKKAMKDINGDIVAGSGDTNDEDHAFFRSKKAMLIWKKALQKHKGDASVLNPLRQDLIPIDQELMQLKKIQYENRDPYGDMEAALDERVHALLVKYDMAGDAGQDPRMSNKVEDHLNKDKKLDSLYERAVRMGFTAEELEELKAEILHHKLKMAELDALLGKYSTLEERTRLETNVVGKTEGKDVTGGNIRLKELKDAIKDKRQELGESMSKLGLMSENSDLNKEATFTQTKVLRLWTDILKSNFTEDERMSLRQELMHLENKMNKRDKLVSEAAVLDKHHKDQGHKMDDSKKEKYLEKKGLMKEKSDHLDKHVNKYMKDINSRISDRRRHSEL